ncbi:unnamed protein product [Brassica napus]|uniref:(rape) hypothetical protein n=1 Tax=Brassica napus TaxID=3708 RepID=A0A816N7D9_BRANA|nr:unnamed protein product [Brassica napus]
MTSQLQTINFLCIGKVTRIKTANGWYYISQAPTERNLLSHASHVMIQMWLVSSGSYPSLIKPTKLCSSTKLKNVHTAEVGHLKGGDYWPDDNRYGAISVSSSHTKVDTKTAK